MSVTINGGPFTDGRGNALSGEYQFQPVPEVGYDGDAVPTEEHGTLDVTTGQFTQSVAPGTYVFKLRTEAFYVEQQITIAASPATQMIESLI